MGRIVGLSPAALPYYGMPQMICRTCMTTIANTALFCVVSGTIASWMPPEVRSIPLIEYFRNLLITLLF